VPVLSQADTVRLKADLATLEQSLKDCSDTGLRHVIETWIEVAERTLAQRRADVVARFPGIFPGRTNRS
jgi:hypothetical protein